MSDILFRGHNRRWCLLGVCGLMFAMGLVMVTDAGMYVLQLFDNHAATYSALIIGCSEVFDILIFLILP